MSKAAEAWATYAQRTERDVDEWKHPVSSTGSTTAEFDSLVTQYETKFSTFRNKKRKLWTFLKTSMKHLQRIAKVAKGAVEATSFPMGAAIMQAGVFLIDSGNAVSDDYEALEKLFSRIHDMSERLNEYIGGGDDGDDEPGQQKVVVQMDHRLRRMVVRLMCSIIDVFGDAEAAMKRGRGREMLRHVAGKESRIQETLRKMDEKLLAEMQLLMAKNLSTAQQLRAGVEMDRSSGQLRELLKTDATRANATVAQDIIRQRIPNSGEWLLREKEYQMWVTMTGDVEKTATDNYATTSSFPVLFVFGGPGTGKTFAASRVIHELCKNPCIVVAYFYILEGMKLRHTPEDILKTLAAQVAASYKIHLHEELSKKDIGRFIRRGVDGEIGKDGSPVAGTQLLRKMPPKAAKHLRREIIDALSKNAGGMFLLVKLMLAEIRNMNKPALVRQTLAKPPSGLDDMFRRVIARLVDARGFDKDDLNELIMWVACAQRDLRLGELDHIIKIRDPDQEGIIGLEDELRTRFGSFFTAMVKPKYSQEKGAAIASNSIILSSTNKKYTGGNRDVRQDNEMFFSTNMPGRKLIEFCGLVNMNIQNASLYVKLNEPRKVLSIVLPLRIKLENILYTQPRLLSAKKFLLEILKLLNTSHYVIALANKQDHVNASAALEAALASHQLEPSHIYGMFSVIKTACQMGVFAEVVCLLQKMRNRGEQGAVLLADLWDYDWFTFELVSYAFSQMGKKDLARDLYIWLSTTLDSLVSFIISSTMTKNMP
ncbi:MAG: hypothetical protein STHCBS139747_007461 [Sporothrix thermara]